MRAVVVLIAAFMSACAGSDGWLPSAERVTSAARDAALEPETWLPAAGAVAFGVSGLDDDLADWASDETPIFGSSRRAADASDALRDSLVAGMAATALLAPVDGGYHRFPAQRLAANGLAYWTAEGVVGVLKESVKRERPDGSDRLSFPSGHAGSAFTSATLLRRNLGPSIDSPTRRAALDIGAIGAAAATGWARIEAEKHYPADMLASAALGNFLASFFHRALTDDDGDEPPPVRIEAEPGGVMLSVARVF